MPASNDLWCEVYSKNPYFWAPQETFVESEKNKDEKASLFRTFGNSHIHYQNLLGPISFIQVIKKEHSLKIASIYYKWSLTL